MFHTILARVQLTTYEYRNVFDALKNYNATVKDGLNDVGGGTYRVDCGSEDLEIRKYHIAPGLMVNTIKRINEFKE